MTPKQNDRVLNRLGDIPSAAENEIPKFRNQDHVDKFFDSQGIVHKESVPEGKTVKTEFYKGVTVRLLMRIRRVLPATFCCRDFFLLHNIAPAHKTASVCQFFT